MNEPNATILLIEDDDAIARSLREGLERDGYSVLRTAGGQDGVNLAQARSPQLIILDVRLPDGVQQRWSIREDSLVWQDR